MKKDGRAVDSPFVFAVTFILFVITSVFIVIALSSKSVKEVETTTSLPTDSEDNLEPESLSEYFQIETQTPSTIDDSLYREIDPFREKCLSDGENDVPYIVSGVKCYY